jgi:Rne/Rng family ribonuclease
MPFSKSIHSVKTLEVENQKDYLRAMGHLLINPRKIGMLVNHKLLNANIKFLMKEVQVLTLRWRKVTRKIRKKRSPSLISKRKIFLHKILQDHSNLNFSFIAIDSYEGALKIKNILTKIHGSKIHSPLKIEFHRYQFSLIKYYLVDVLLLEIMKPRVNLCRGGYIVIEKTEALTTIDVNSGSFTNLQSSRQTSLWVNYSAAYEIVKQIRLRNLGGIIIIDFIDSTSQVDQMKLLHYMSRLVKKDFVKCTIIQMSELGLVEMTRTRYGQSIYDAFSRRCVMCNGLGHLTLNLGIINHKNYELLLTNISRFNKIS